ncbi:MAG: cytochrome b/b6 domain-containing protein [Pelagimonas sp.]|jgi:cytochrome b|nr:cytochrome b/b6 domain-containing protein [Pelagimonas sp.]
MTEQIPKGVTREKIWDIGLRLFHWALVICVGLSWYLGEFGPDVMTLHFYVGYAVIALLVFRLVWGLVGPAPARFAHFFPWPRKLFSYLGGIKKREPSYYPGHNPVGALSVFAILGVLAVQVGSGLFADPDDYINVGPLAHLVSSEGTRLASQLHEIFSKLILLLVAVHLAAIVFYKIYKHEDLVRPMITGWKWVRRDHD